MNTTTTAMGSFYDPKRAASELRRYREKGPIPSTRALIEALVAEGVEGATLLDIGGGIGAIQHELLDAGVTHATSVDASAPYLSAARSECKRRGHDGRVTYLHGDFVELAESVPPADIVTLDRVVKRLSGLGAACRACRRAGSAIVRSRVSARHPHGEARRLRNESDAAAPEEAAARGHPLQRRDRADRPRERSRSPRLEGRRASVARRSLPPRIAGAVLPCLSPPRGCVSSGSLRAGELPS